jgi:WD40 repeat protein
MVRCRTCLGLVSVLVAFGASAFGEQVDRRDRREPELIVEAGGRQGSCDCLRFTPDGNHLLAAGDDKVIRSWEFAGGALIEPPLGVGVLRWSSWREQRGAIYALALSPVNPRLVAIGGIGARGTNAVAVLDRDTGEILRLSTCQHPTDKDRSLGPVRALTFAKTGDDVVIGTQDGSIWLWSFRSGDPELLGGHDSIKDREHNLVRLVHFLKEDTLLSVAESGQALQWDVRHREKPPQQFDLFSEHPPLLFKVTVSPNGRWLAAATTTTHEVLVRSLRGGNQIGRKLNERQFCRNLTFSPDGKRLAFSIGSRIPAPENWFMEADDEIFSLDLDDPERATRVAPEHRGRAENLTFHPDGRFLAVAGGDNHEVTLWDTEKRQTVSVMRSKGSGLWGVGLSSDGHTLAFQEKRDPRAADPNHRGMGPWRVFDLTPPGYKPGKNFVPAAVVDTLGGWRVEPDAHNPYLWRAVHSDRRPLDLKLDRERDLMPRCYTFLQPAKEGGPVRLAVGHYYGVSVFELRETEAKRIWRGVGHQGEVMALAVSEERKLLVSASNDQTISAWSLKDRQSGWEVGATFELREDEKLSTSRLYVTGVDLFSPAWEANLVRGDEVVALHYAGKKLIFSLAGGVGSADAALKQIRDADPGKELLFHLRREGHDGILKTLTTVPRRPLWRFFPANHGKDWVLWMWGFHYYITSTRGEDFIGWHVNIGADLEKKPSFYPAEQLRDSFLKQTVFNHLLDDGDLREALESVKKDRQGLAPPNFVKIRPAPVVVTVDRTEVTDTPVSMTVTLRRHDDNPDYSPQRAELWVNGHRYMKLNRSKISRAFARGSVEFTIPPEVMRSGENRLTFQVYNSVEGFGEGRAEGSVVVTCKRKEAAPTLVALVVGIKDYGSAKVKLLALPETQADADAIAEILQNQEGKAFAHVHVTKVIDRGDRSERGRIQAALKRFAEMKLRAEDHFILFLAGHGDLVHLDPRKPDTKNFVFCCTDFDPNDPENTAILDRDLYEMLVDLPCGKTLLLDSCHSGQAIIPAHYLAPAGTGPSILTACDIDQESLAKPGEHGLFTQALLEAMGKNFHDADRDPVDGYVDFRELAAYVKQRVPELLAENMEPGPQIPQVAPRDPPAVRLIKKLRR